MSRSIWKGPFQEKKILKPKIRYKKRIEIWARNSIIPFRYLKKLVFIHTGNTFKKIYISRNHIGYKFGEFAVTRAFKTKNEQKKHKKKNK